MILSAIVWGAPRWAVPVAVIGTLVLLLAVWSYWRAPARAWVRILAGLLKATAIVALALCVVEPLFSGVRPRPGANLFLLLADNSQGMQIKDAGRRENRGTRMQRELTRESTWQTRLSQDFDVRRYVFDTRLRPIVDYTGLTFTGEGSAMTSALETVTRRYRGRPNAGVLLFTDGNATDLADGAIDWSRLPPVYPVVVGEDKPARDISIARLSVTQTNFEAAPVTAVAEIESQGYQGKSIIVQLLDQDDQEIQRQQLNNRDDDKRLVHRFQFRPEQPGISFYRVRAFAESEERQFERPEKSVEATLSNNSRLVMVDRGGGPYRVLYLSGRPNWDFKFLRRAIAEDDEVNLVGLIRIAKKEPKFTFRGRTGEDTNPLYRGFGNQEDEEAEQYDQPVMLRLGTRDAEELRDGFPKAADELFEYHAIVIDDLEAAFFDQDQMSLIQEFVSQRGGGFLMLGGRESFIGGKYDRTPIGELLPVYLDRVADEPAETFRFDLTREGLLQPWIRLRATEQGEQKRLAEMPEFKTFNRVGTLKPGASVLADVESNDAKAYPALVVQRFGKGRSAALLIGDLWRWNLRRLEADESDLEKAWRQTIRWMVADVPGRIEVDVRRGQDDATRPIELQVLVRDEFFKPLDNAAVTVEVSTPENKQVELTAAPSDTKAGVYVATFAPQAPGAYRAQVVVAAADGSEVGQRETGWVSEPATLEFRALRPNRGLLERIAKQTGGEVLEENGLPAFVASLPNRKIPVTEPWIYPLWHQWSVFTLAICCLIGEWGLRRWRGLA